MTLPFVLARLSPDALADLSRRIGAHAAPYAGLVAYNRQLGEVTARDGSRRKVAPGEVETATGWHVETNAAGARIVKARFANDGAISTFAPSWLDRCEPR